LLKKNKRIYLFPVMKTKSYSLLLISFLLQIIVIAIFAFILDTAVIWFGALLIISSGLTYIGYKKTLGDFNNLQKKHSQLKDQGRSTEKALTRLNNELEEIIKERTLAIAKTELRFRKIFDSRLIAILFSTKDGVITEANSASLNMLGITEEEIKNGTLKWDDITDPRDSDKVISALNEISNIGYCEPFEKRYIKKDGTIITGLIGAAVLDDERIVTYIIDITERKFAEQKEATLQNIIQQQRHELEHILMDTPYMISIRRGDDLKMEMQNKAYTAFTNRNDVGKPLNEVSEGFKKHNVYQALWNVYHTGAPYSGKAMHVVYDKYQNGTLTDAWFDYTFIPLYDIDRKVNGVATFGFDVSELVLANKSISESEERLRFLADAIPHKVWTAMPNGTINYFNKVWISDTGFTETHLNDKGIFVTMHPEDKPLIEKMWNDTRVTGYAFEMECRMINKDGQYHWHLLRAIPQKDDNGNIILWIGTITNIHHQKTIEDSLRTSEDYFRQVSDQVPFMIWKVDEKGMANYVNKTWIDFTGLSFEESLGRNWMQALHPEDKEQEVANFVVSFEKQTDYSSKFRLRRNDGEYRWVMNQSHPLFTPAFVGYIGSLTDITEQELTQQRNELLLKQKDEFMSIASHELKTPIASMKAYLQLGVRMTTADTQLYDFLEKANRQATKLSALVEDLLDVSKIQAGKMLFLHSSFSLNELIKDCIEQVSHYSNNHSIIVEQLDDVTVYADKHRIEQVLINLLTNAIKYSPDAKPIMLSSVVEKGYVRTAVKDFGIGIPADKKTNVFDRFFRVHNSSQHFPGLGLGLYISAEIINRHNGLIGVETEEGRGSEFWFTLPLPPNGFSKSNR